MLLMPFLPEASLEVQVYRKWSFVSQLQKQVLFYSSQYGSLSTSPIVTVCRTLVTQVR